MPASFAKNLASLASDRRGTVAVIFATAVLPLLVFVFAALDYGGAVRLRTKLQSALDRTVLATAHYVTANPSAGESAVRDYAEQQLKAAMKPDAVSVTGFKLENGRTVITVQGTSHHPARVIGNRLAAPGGTGMAVTAAAQVDRGTTSIEVAMVLDNTGSMATNNRIGKLRDAAASLVDILEKSKSDNRTIKVALVPFVTAVNVRGAGFKWSWIDQAGDAKFNGDNFPSKGNGRYNHLDLFAEMRDEKGDPVAWKGCVEARPEPYDTNDTAPNSANPDSLFVPYFWPDEPDKGSGYTNNYMNDDFPSNQAEGQPARQMRMSKYNTSNRAKVSEGGGNTSGPNKSCPTPILPLTEDFAEIRKNIAAMREWNNSGTNIAEGLAWGERVLSPQEPYTEGAAWGKSDVQKIVILLTDGENVIFGQNDQTSGPTTHNKSDYSSVGYLAKKRLGVDTPNEAKDVLLKKVGTVCDSLKEKVNGREKTMVYTITFEIPNNTLRQAFRSCASRPEMYFDSPNVNQLKTVFETIARQITALRISQ